MAARPLVTKLRTVLHAVFSKWHAAYPLQVRAAKGVIPAAAVHILALHCWALEQVVQVRLSSTAMQKTSGIRHCRSFMDNK
jgi:hypothetical protein